MTKPENFTLLYFTIFNPTEKSVLQDIQARLYFDDKCSSLNSLVLRYLAVIRGCNRVYLLTAITCYWPTAAVICKTHLLLSLVLGEDKDRRRFLLQNL